MGALPPAKDCSCFILLIHCSVHFLAVFATGVEKLPFVETIIIF